MEYFFAAGNEQRGPFAPEQLAAQGVTADTLVWRDGMEAWKPAREVPELAGMFAPQAAAVPQTGPVSGSAMGPTGYPEAVPAAALPYQSPMDVTGNTNGMAIASMVLGIVALVTMLCDGFGLIPGILAIIFGVIAKKQIGQSDAQGRSMATAGIICGWIAVGLVVLGIIVVIGIVIVSQHH